MENSNKNFTHMHVHDFNSYLDGHGSPASKARRAKELGMKAIATTNHNHLGGCIDFQKACKDENIKPLLGVELYYTEDTNILSLDAKTRTKMATDAAIADGVIIPPKALKKDIANLIAPYQYDNKSHHILFLAQTQEGWSNLVKLQSEAARTCTYNGRYHCDDAMIEKYKEGLIMTTACASGAPSKYIRRGEIDKAYAKLDKWREILGDNLYIEIQPATFEDQGLCNYHLIRYAQKHNVKLISTNDAHYTYESDVDDHDTLLCIGIGKLKDDPDRMRYSPEFWLRSYDEMITAYMSQYLNNPIINENFSMEEYMDIIRTSLENTNEIADKVDENIKLGSDTPILPKVEIPNSFTSSQYLMLLSYKALFKYLSKHPELDTRKYIKRLDFELKVINTKGYADYMLIVKDIVDWCEKEGIPVGPGRGSAAGSLCLFLNGITKCVDPIKYGLLFSRFLTMDRTSLPDIDTDFSYLNRHRIIKYLKDKYGEDCVSYIGTNTELGVKNGLKDVGRVLRIDFNVMNDLSKKITDITDNAPSIKFKNLDKLKDGDAKDQSKYTEFKQLEDQYSELFRAARALEGTPRNQGVHASGILITPFPVNNIFPTRIDEDGSLVTLCTGPQAEMIGGVKIDILGLKTLDVLDLTVKALKSDATVYELYDIVDKHLNDSKMFGALCRKETEGIFQLESDLFKGLVSDMTPDKLDDITLITSFGRPGPLSAGLHTEFAKRKRGDNDSIEPLPNTWDIVEDSLGVLAYQEHTMRIAQRVAGFDDNQADSFLRKAQAKKKRDLLDLCNQWFVYGKINAKAPIGYDYDNKNQPYYDPTSKYGSPIKGGIANGYKEQDLIDYNHMIDGFCSYLFNKSHACAYSFISLCTMYLKTYHNVEFMAALLSLQEKAEKIDLYCRISQDSGIEIKIPDINISTEFFTASGNKILYGLNSIKGIGAGVIQKLIEARPYASFEDAYEKLGKVMNKKVGEALIKAGAFDFDNTNRHQLLNKFAELRKDKKAEDYNENIYGETECIEMEREILGSAITYKPFWDTVRTDEIVSVEMELENVREKLDKKGNMMGFVEAKIGHDKVKGIVFASIYCKNAELFDMNFNKKVTAKIQKDSKGGFILKSILKSLPNRQEMKSKNISSTIIKEFDDMLKKAI